eukprot:3625402-Alexandrium_andersonii.AAC.1
MMRAGRQVRHPERSRDPSPPRPYASARHCGLRAPFQSGESIGASAARATSSPPPSPAADATRPETSSGPSGTTCLLYTSDAADDM